MKMAHHYHSLLSLISQSLNLQYIPAIKITYSQRLTTLPIPSPKPPLVIYRPYMIRVLSLCQWTTIIGLPASPPPSAYQSSAFYNISYCACSGNFLPQTTPEE